MVSVAPEMWDLLERAYAGGALAASFAAAWDNGQAFLAAPDALRGRRPAIVEWKGSHRAPGDEVAPIDLRIDHVFLISCKYLSKIMINASPAHLFDRLLLGGHGTRGGDWYTETAGDLHQHLYEAVRGEVDLPALPSAVIELTAADRRQLGEVLAGGWPGGAGDIYQHLVDAVAEETARRWQALLSSATSAEAMLWRILRMGSAPYFVLGASPSAALRLRVATPWDWRLHYRLTRFECSAERRGQPRVGWVARVADRHSSQEHEIRGHVEIRWSHGRFGGNPEAKLYLDTPHAAVPGYIPLCAGYDERGP
jgi:hypothetical protein